MLRLGLGLELGVAGLYRQAGFVKQLERMRNEESAVSPPGRHLPAHRNSLRL